MPPTVSTFAQLALGAVGTGSGPLPLTQLIEFEDYDSGVEPDFADGNRNRGTLNRRKLRTRLRRKKVRPKLKCVPTALEWTYLLPWILGAAAAGTTYNLGNSIFERAIGWADGNGNTENATGVAVMEAVIGTAGNPEGLLQCELTLLGKDFETSTAFPVLSNLDNATAQFILPDSSSAVVIGGTTVTCTDLQLRIVMKLNPDRFWNSLTLTGHTKVDRDISLTLMYPDGDHPTVYAAAEAGVAVTVTFTCPDAGQTVSMAWSLPDVRFPRKPRKLPLRGEVVNALEGYAYETNTPTPPLTITLDSTP